MTSLKGTFYTKSCVMFSQLLTIFWPYECRKKQQYYIKCNHIESNAWMLNVFPIF